MRQHHALRQASGSRRVDEESHLLGWIGDRWSMRAAQKFIRNHGCVGLPDITHLTISNNDSVRAQASLLRSCRNNWVLRLLCNNSFGTGIFEVMHKFVGQESRVQRANNAPDCDGSPYNGRNVN